MTAHSFIRWYPDIRVFVAACMLCLVPALSHGDSGSDQIAAEAARVAAEAATKEAVKSWADAQTAGGSLGAGTATFAAVDLALAANDFTHAETDRQRFYAGLRAGSAVYILSSGPGAPVVALAVVAATIVEAGLGARHAAAMLEIYKRIAEDQQRIAEIRTTLALADAIAFQTLMSQLMGHLAITALSEQNVSKNCTNREFIKTIEDLDQCAFWTISYYLHAESVVDVSNRLLVWDSDNISAQRVFEKVGLAKDKLTTTRDEYSKLLQSKQKALSKFKASYLELSFTLLQEKVLDTPAFSTEEFVSLSCINTAGQIVRNSNRVRFDANKVRTNGMTKLQRIAVKTRMTNTLQSLKTYQASMCPPFSTASEDKERVLVRPWVQLVLKSKSSLASELKALEN